MRQKLIELYRETNKSTVVVGEFNTPPSEVGIQQEKINKDITELNDTIDQPAMIDICRLLYQTTADYILFSNSYGTFTKIDHLLGQKTHLKNC